MLSYRQVGVWREGDYAHVVLGSPLPVEGLTRSGPRSVRRLYSRAAYRLPLPRGRKARLELVRRRLGPGAYP